MEKPFTQIAQQLSTLGCLWTKYEPTTFARVFSIPRIFKDFLNNGAELFPLQFHSKTSIELWGKTASTVGFLSAITHYWTKTETSFDGMRPQQISMIVNVPKIACGMKPSRCAKRSCALRCSRKSLVPPRPCARCWSKFPEWLLLIRRF